MATITRQSVKVSARTGQLLRVLSALDGRSQAEINEDAVAAYVESRKRSLKARLGEVQQLLDKGGPSAVSDAWGSRTARNRGSRKG